MDTFIIGNLALLFIKLRNQSKIYLVNQQSGDRNYHYKSTPLSIFFFTNPIYTVYSIYRVCSFCLSIHQKSKLSINSDYTLHILIHVEHQNRTPGITGSQLMCTLPFPFSDYLQPKIPAKIESQNMINNHSFHINQTPIHIATKTELINTQKKLKDSPSKHH